MRGIDPGKMETQPPLRPRFFKNGPDVLYEIRNIDSHTHITIGYIHPAMLEAYLFQVDHMFHNPEQHVEVGYTCSFSYNWNASPGDKPAPPQDHIINVVPKRFGTVFADGPGLVSGLSLAFERARATVAKDNAALAATCQGQGEHSFDIGRRMA